jgi:hypothetical protein
MNTIQYMLLADVFLFGSHSPQHQTETVQNSFVELNPDAALYY